jgi:hypothetical protein
MVASGMTRRAMAMDLSTPIEGAPARTVDRTGSGQDGPADRATAYNGALALIEANQDSSESSDEQEDRRVNAHRVMNIK